MFDFPTGPAVGQVFQPAGGPAWQWDGEKWKGGQIAGPQKELFVDLAGKTSIDIAVPTWAKSVQLNGMVFSAGGSNGVWMRVSGDGTTFGAGAGDYASAGPQHASGTAAYSSYPQTNAAQIFLSPGSDSIVFPINFTAEFAVVRPSTAQVFGGKVYCKVFDSAAAQLHRHWQTVFYPQFTATTSLTIKALRFLSATGVAFAAGSTLHIRWLGDDAQVPSGNAVGDAPNDGYFYTRRNGVWEKQQGSIFDYYAFDSTALSATTVEAALGTGVTFLPLQTDSKCFVHVSAYASLTTTAVVDDVRGRIYWKWYNDSIYTGIRGTIVFGQVNAFSGNTQSWYYRLNHFYELPNTEKRASGAFTIRPYGLADYASVRLDCYDVAYHFWETQS